MSVLIIYRLFQERKSHLTLWKTSILIDGARGRTRTCDLPVISRVLQPTKLPAQRQVGDRPSHHKDDGMLQSSIASGSFACM